MGHCEGDEGATGALRANLHNGKRTMDDQVWKDLSDDWQRYLLEKEERLLPRDLKVESS